MSMAGNTPEAPCFLMLTRPFLKEFSSYFHVSLMSDRYALKSRIVGPRVRIFRSGSYAMVLSPGPAFIYFSVDRFVCPEQNRLL